MRELTLDGKKIIIPMVFNDYYEFAQAASLVDIEYHTYMIRQTTAQPWDIVVRGQRMATCYDKTMALILFQHILFTYGARPECAKNADEFINLHQTGELSIDRILDIK